MNRDIRVSTTWDEHPKFRKLEKRLGAEAVLGVFRLWAYAGRVAFDGVFRDMDSYDIAHIAKWRGDPNKFVSTLLDLRLMDRNSGDVAIHDWPEWNARAMSYPARSRVARENAIRGWHKRRGGKTKENQELNATGNADSKANSNAPPPPPPPPPKEEGRGDPAPSSGEDGGLVSPSTENEKPLTIEELIFWQKTIDELALDDPMRKMSEKELNRALEKRSPGELDEFTKQTC
jgi:hypothetical protein